MPRRHMQEGNRLPSGGVVVQVSLGGNECLCFCLQCNYTYFKPADRCVEQNHHLRWHDATKRFFKCPCGQRAIALDRLPNKHCR